MSPGKALSKNNFIPIMNPFSYQDRQLYAENVRLADIAEQVKSAGVRRTAVIIAGKVPSATALRGSHLYSADRAR